MKPDTDPFTNLNLPQPVMEGQVQPVMPESQLTPHEFQAVSPEIIPAANQTMPVAAPTPVLAQQTSVTPAQDQTSDDDAVLAIQSDLQAQDSDVIEKEWVIKVKQIVAETRTDPYQQNKQLALLRADYLHKRYGKIVKLS